MGKYISKNCGNCNVGEAEKSVVDLDALNRLPTISNNYSIIDPPVVNMCLIESYNHHNNIFFQLGKIVKLQRSFKKYYSLKKKKKEHEVKNKKKSDNHKDELRELKVKSSLPKVSKEFSGEELEKEEEEIKVDIEAGVVGPFTNHPTTKKIIFIEEQQHLNTSNASYRREHYRNSLATSQIYYRNRSVESGRFSYSYSIKSNDRELYESTSKGFSLNVKKDIKHTYKGGADRGMRHGFGSVTWEDGTTFKGLFYNDKARGYGHYIEADGCTSFLGEYDSDSPLGWGVYTCKGAMFEGFWEGRKQSKVGQESWPDENYYQGEYKDSKKHGIGTYKWPDGTLYTGEWDNNTITGYGILHFGDERSYMGQLKDGNMHGYGEFFWPDGKKYFGFYEDDVKEGFGIFLWSSSPLKVFIGSWLQGKQHGLGIMINEKKVKYGYWNNGKNELLFQGCWEMKKYAKSERIVCYKVLQKDIAQILALFL